MKRNFLRKDEFCVKEELKEVVNALPKEEYSFGEKSIKVFVDADNHTVWADDKSMSELMGCTVQNIIMHRKSIIEDGVYDESLTCKDFLLDKDYGRREGFTKTMKVTHYNLDIIIELGYRVKSKEAIAFRKWANGIIKDYLTKGYALNEPVLSADELKWRNLYEEVKALRDKEKDDYTLVRELYKRVCPDYDPKVSRKFYGFMQNLLHFAATNHTAAEIIYERADHTKPFMGLQTFAGDKVTKSDVTVAKNYLTKDEMAAMHRIVMAFYYVMNSLAWKKIVVSTNDFTNRLTKLIIEFGCNILCGYGSVDKSDADDKAFVEYSIYSKNQEHLLF